ncbi:MAG: hypothetical protein MZV65_30330 [Chromatiales bacterium]|nr:hypothetical protein [Chromatiales bacterium]
MAVAISANCAAMAGNTARSNSVATATGVARQRARAVYSPESVRTLNPAPSRRISRAAWPNSIWISGRSLSVSTMVCSPPGRVKPRGTSLRRGRGLNRLSAG